MSLKEISPDAVILWKWGFVHVNLTMVFTWAIMALLVLACWIVTRDLSTGTAVSRWQNLLEILVSAMRDHIRDVTRSEPGPYLSFIGTLFLFIAVSNFLAVVPGYVPPTGSLSTTAALAICVFVAVPLYGIMDQGVSGYLRHYIRPTVFMLPFHVIGELSRTLALAVRLFGNIMSGTKIVAILLAVTPFIFPIVIQALGLLTGMIQAYIFSILAMVYIASATRARGDGGTKRTKETARTAERTGKNNPHGPSSTGSGLAHQGMEGREGQERRRSWTASL
ncbi:MAG TPA: F0F1 ATP synthase subunit A [Syntrophorhabdaceae bacterium]|nr:F0F1 ATP synthase subunit A [Syntrophorhabdaceae bacterium]HOD75761.1 F0F1 ATP synthase subunit A [Syntrophorhabdaceae bacterium]